MAIALALLVAMVARNAGERVLDEGRGATEVEVSRDEEEEAAGARLAVGEDGDGRRPGG